MTETTTVVWSAVLDQVEAALAQALRDTETRAKRLDARTDMPARPELRALEDRLRLLPFPVSQAEQADAALAAAEEEVRQWQTRATASRRRLAEEAGGEV